MSLPDVHGNRMSPVDPLSGDMFGQLFWDSVSSGVVISGAQAVGVCDEGEELARGRSGLSQG